MIFFKNPIISAIIVALSVLVFYLANTWSVFGKIANYFFPCQQDPSTSFPCYMGVDVTVMVISVVVGVIFGIVLVINLIQK